MLKISTIKFEYLVIITFSLILLSCNSKNKGEQELTIIAKTLETHLDSSNYIDLKYHAPGKIGQKINLEITNSSERENAYAIMSCHYIENFKLNNPHLKFLGINCDSNYPSEITLKPDETVQYDFVVLKDRNVNIKGFRIGFKIIKIPDSLDHIDEYHKQIQNPNLKIIWSNPLDFKN